MIWGVYKTKIEYYITQGSLKQDYRKTELMLMPALIHLP